MSLTLFDERVPFNESTTLNDSAGTGQFSVQSNTALSYRLDYLWVMSNDSVDHLLNLFLSGSSYFGQICQLNIPAGTGVNGVAPLDVLALWNGVPGLGIALEPNAMLMVALDVAMTAGDLMIFTAVGGTL